MRFLSPINDQNGTRNEKRAEALLPLLRGVMISVPSGGQQICCRYEKIREHADTFLRSDDEILLYVQDRLRRNEKKADERAEQVERRAARRKALDRRMGRSGILVADRPKRDEIRNVNQVVADAQNAFPYPNMGRRRDRA